MTDIDEKVGGDGMSERKKTDSFEENEHESLNDFKEYYRKIKKVLTK